jgi:hypothetical protein
MTDQEQRDFIRFLCKELKAYSRELAAYQLMVATLKARGIQAVGLENLLAECRTSETLRKKIDADFQPLEEILPPASEDFAEMAKRLLSEWKPTGRPN